MSKGVTLALAMFSVLYKFSLVDCCVYDVYNKIMKNRLSLNITEFQKNDFWWVGLSSLSRGKFQTALMRFGEIYNNNKVDVILIRNQSPLDTARIKLTQENQKKIKSIGFLEKPSANYDYYIYKGPGALNIAYMCDPSKTTGNPTFFIFVNMKEATVSNYTYKLALQDLGQIFYSVSIDKLARP